jgi:hypothetical protein
MFTFWCLLGAFVLGLFIGTNLGVVLMGAVYFLGRYL